MWFIALALASTTHFTDLPPNHVAYPAVEHLVEQQVIRGYEDNTFLPDRVLTRAEALKISLLASGYSPSSTTDAGLSDVPTDSWFKPYVDFAVEKGFIKGYDDKTFRPNQNISRAEGVKVLFSSFGIQLPTAPQSAYSDIQSDNWFYPYASVLKTKNLWDPETILFEPNEGLTRAEIANLAYNLALRKEAKTLPIIPIWACLLAIILWGLSSLISVRFWKQIIKSATPLWIISIITAPLGSIIYVVLGLLPRIVVRHTDTEEPHKNPIYVLLKPRKLGVEFFQYFASRLRPIALASLVFLINFLLGYILLVTYYTYLYRISLS